MTVGHRPRVGRAFRRIALLGATALLFALLPVGVAFAEHFENTEVLDADNAVEAGVNWSEFTFDSATDVALGRNDKFPDNLASSVIQGTDTPLLYTDGDALSEETSAELDRLGAETVHVLGGEEAISEDVVDELEALGYETHRDAGETRIETALDVAATHAADATHGLVVRAFGDAQGDETRAWADALAAGGWAAEEGWPVFLTQTEELNDNVRAYLEDSNIESLTIIGGVSAVSAAVQTELESMGIDVDRVSGSNRFATAVAIANARGFEDAGDTDEVILAEGQQSDAWAGGFAAAAYSAISGAPIVLSNGENIPPETEEFLQGGADGAATQEHGSVHLVCGPFVEPEACAEAAQILGHEHAPHGNEDFAVTPQESATQANNTTRQYTVSGITAERVDIVLFNCGNTTNSDGTYTFTGNTVAADNDTAAPGNVNGATITVVNGVAGGGTDQVVPQNGSVTFTVSGPGANTPGGCVQPVVFGDTDDDDALDIGSNNQPTEPFGVGGETTFAPANATSGNIPASQVTSTDKANNRFAACSDAAPATQCFSYAYDANDLFNVNGQSVGLDAFEAVLSGGDDITGTYTTDPGGVSTFTLTDDSPAAPTNVSTASSGPTSTTVTLTWTDSATPTTDAYRIYRIQSTGPAVNCPSTTSNTSLTTTETPARAYTQLAQVADKTGTSAADGTYTYTDQNLTPNTRYCYIVRAVDDGDESENSGASSTQGQAGTTPAAASNPGAPRISNVNAQDAGLTGTVDDGDTHQFIFDQPMAATVDDAGSTYRIQDTDATPSVADIICGTNATCVLQPAGTYNGVAYPADQVMRVQITQTPTGAQLVQAGSVAGVQYPATITAVTATHWRDADENLVLDLAGSPDKTIENTGTFTPAANTTAPTQTGGSQTTPGDFDTFTFTFSEPVRVLDVNGFDVFSDNACTVPVTDGATVASGDRTSTIVINMDGAAGVATNTRYLQAANNAVQDLDGNPNTANACTAVVLA